MKDFNKIVQEVVTRNRKTGLFHQSRKSYQWKVKFWTETDKQNVLMHRALGESRKWTGEWVVSGLAGQRNKRQNALAKLPTHSLFWQGKNGRNDGTYKISTESTSPKRGKLGMDKVGGKRKVKIPRKNDELGKRSEKWQEKKKSLRLIHAWWICHWSRLHFASSRRVFASLLDLFSSNQIDFSQFPLDADG